MKKKLYELERMSPMERRRFLKYMSLALVAPLVPAALRHAAHSIAGGAAFADALPGASIEVTPPRADGMAYTSIAAISDLSIM